MRKLAGIGTVVLVAVAALGAGCGGGSTASEADFAPVGDSEPDLPPIWDSPGQFLIDVGKELAWSRTRSDCRRLRRINRRSLHKFDCPLAVRQAHQLRFRGTRGEAAYGSGAVVDYKTGDVAAAIAILNVDPSDRWAVTRYGIAGEPVSTSSDRQSRAGFDAVVADYLQALRAGDCEEFAGVSLPREGERACPTAFRRVRGLAALLDSNADATPAYLGGNRRFGFYGLVLERPTRRYWTINVARDGHRGSGYAVMDAVPGPLPDY